MRVPPATAGGQDRSALVKRLPAIAVGILCLAPAAWLGLAQRDAERLEEANRLGAAGRYDAAADEAARVTRDPAAARASLVRAYALREDGDLRRAERAFAIAAREDPANWVVQRDRAVVLARLGRARAASDAMARALQLNPRMPLPAGFAPSRPARRP